MSDETHGKRARGASDGQAQQVAERLRVEDPAAYTHAIERIQRFVASKRFPLAWRQYVAGKYEAVLVKIIASFGREAAPWATWQIRKAACRVAIEGWRADQDWRHHHL